MPAGTPVHSALWGMRRVASCRDLVTETMLLGNCTPAPRVVKPLKHCERISSEESFTFDRRAQIGAIGLPLCTESRTRLKLFTVGQSKFAALHCEQNQGHIFLHETNRFADSQGNNMTGLGI
eukprot:1157976-Pelagomonas_calceolata.AAC.11